MPAWFVALFGEASAVSLLVHPHLCFVVHADCAHHSTSNRQHECSCKLLRQTVVRYGALTVPLQDRVAKLQELYMRDLDQSKAICTVHENIQQSNLLQLATPEMLAISQPPAGFPVPEDARSSRIIPALHEVETLRRERAALREQVRRCKPSIA